MGANSALILFPAALDRLKKYERKKALSQIGRRDKQLPPGSFQTSVTEKTEAGARKRGLCLL